MTHRPVTSRKIVKTSKVMSDEEVARFLEQLAGLYRDKRSGNLLLSEALMRVAGKLRQQSEEFDFLPKKLKGNNSSEMTSELNFMVTSLDNMDLAAIESFIKDERRTKVNLMDLAMARFSIPRSRLLKLTTEGVREALRSALTHESSLTVLSEEAARYGSKRQS